MDWENGSGRDLWTEEARQVRQVLLQLAHRALVQNNAVMMFHLLAAMDMGGLLSRQEIQSIFEDNAWCIPDLLEALRDESFSRFDAEGLRWGEQLEQNPHIQQAAAYLYENHRRLFHSGRQACQSFVAFLSGLAYTVSDVCNFSFMHGARMQAFVHTVGTPAFLYECAGWMEMHQKAGWRKSRKQSAYEQYCLMVSYVLLDTLCPSLDVPALIARASSVWKKIPYVTYDNFTQDQDEVGYLEVKTDLIRLLRCAAAADVKKMHEKLRKEQDTIANTRKEISRLQMYQQLASQPDPYAVIDPQLRDTARRLIEAVCTVNTPAWGYSIVQTAGMKPYEELLHHMEENLILTSPKMVWLAASATQAGIALEEYVEKVFAAAPAIVLDRAWNTVMDLIQAAVFYPFIDSQTPAHSQAALYAWMEKAAVALGRQPLQPEEDLREWTLDVMESVMQASEDPAAAAALQQMVTDLYPQWRTPYKESQALLQMPALDTVSEDEAAAWLEACTVELLYHLLDPNWKILLPLSRFFVCNALYLAAALQEEAVHMQQEKNSAAGVAVQKEQVSEDDLLRSPQLQEILKQYR